MATVEERMKILKMVEEAKITAEEGARLLAALADSRKASATSGGSSPGGDPRWFRVRVTDTATGKAKVNLNLPIGLLNVGLKMGARFAPQVEEVDLRQALDAIRAGGMGKIIDVVDDVDGEHVEIFVE